MDPNEVKRLIEAGMPGATVEVNGDGRHFEATVVSADFAGKSLIQQHRMVMAAVKDHIRDDVLHALSIKTQMP